MYPEPTYRPAIEMAIATEHLRDAASKASSPDIVLGLALLAQAGNPAREELCAGTWATLESIREQLRKRG